MEMVRFESDPGRFRKHPGKESVSCRRCGRALTSPKSRASGHCRECHYGIVGVIRVQKRASESPNALGRV